MCKLYDFTLTTMFDFHKVDDVISLLLHFLTYLEVVGWFLGATPPNRYCEGRHLLSRGQPIQ